MRNYVARNVHNYEWQYQNETPPTIKETVDYACKAYHHCLEAHETLSLADFADRIALFYDQSQPVNAAIIRALKLADSL